MSYLWKFACEDCETTGPDFKRGAGGLHYDDRDVRQFLIDHEFHAVLLLGEGTDLEYRLGRPAEPSTPTPITRYCVEVEAGGTVYLGYTYQPQDRPPQPMLWQMLAYRAGDEAGTMVGTWKGSTENIEP